MPDLLDNQPPQQPDRPQVLISELSRLFSEQQEVLFAIPTSVKSLDLKDRFLRVDFLMKLDINAGEAELDQIASNFTNSTVVKILLKKRLQIAKAIRDSFEDQNLLKPQTSSEVERQRVTFNDFFSRVNSEGRVKEITNTKKIYNIVLATFDELPFTEEEFNEFFETNLGNGSIFREYLNILAQDSVTLPLSFTVYNTDVNPNLAQRMMSTSELHAEFSNMNGESYLKGIEESRVLAMIHTPAHRSINNLNPNEIFASDILDQEAGNAVSIFYSVCLYIANALDRESPLIHSALQHAVFQTNAGLVVKNPPKSEFQKAPKYLMSIMIEGDPARFIEGLTKDIGYLADLIRKLHENRARYLVPAKEVQLVISNVKFVVEKLENFLKANPYLANASSAYTIYNELQRLNNEAQRLENPRRF